MADEKKDEAQQAAPAPAADVKAVPAKTQKMEKPSTCTQCSKSIKKKQSYYRNGKYFCGKRCWKTSTKKEEAAPEAAQGQAQ